MYFLDTNILIYFKQFGLEKFSPKVKKILENRSSLDKIFIAPFVDLEMQYLFESKKEKDNPKKIFKDLEKEDIFIYKDLNTFLVTSCASDLLFTRDPFDRLITASASCCNAYLITSDRLILKNYKKAIW